jgi:intracellular septation protein A
LVQGIVLTIVINGAIPLFIYNILLGHFSSFKSLLIATLIPVADNLFHVLRYRKADAFGLFMLTNFILSLLAFALSGNEKLILMRESMITGILGLIFLGSLFYSKPLMYYFAIRFSAGDETKNREKFEANWSIAYFRFVLRFLTGIWGTALLGEAILKIILVNELSISEFLAVSQIILYSVMGAAIVFTVLYRRYAKTRLDMLINTR